MALTAVQAGRVADLARGRDALITKIRANEIPGVLTVTEGVRDPETMPGAVMGDMRTPWIAYAQASMLRQLPNLVCDLSADGVASADLPSAATWPWPAEVPNQAAMDAVLSVKSLYVRRLKAMATGDWSGLGAVRPLLNPWS